MTLGKCILDLRKRLQDMRQRNGSLIASAGTDGVRWTLSELLDVVNEAHEEFFRYASMIAVNIENTNAVNRLINSRILRVADLSETDGEEVIASVGIYLISHLTRAEYPSSFQYYTPQKYRERLTEASDNEVSKTRPIFTYERNSDTEFVIKWSPSSQVEPEPASTELKYYYIPYDQYESGDLDNELFVTTSFYDVLLDIAERVCRDRNNEWGKSAQLDRRIMSKFGLGSLDNGGANAQQRQ